MLQVHVARLDLLLHGVRPLRAILAELLARHVHLDTTQDTETRHVRARATDKVLLEEWYGALSAYERCCTLSDDDATHESDKQGSFRATVRCL